MPLPIYDTPRTSVGPWGNPAPQVNPNVRGVFGTGSYDAALNTQAGDYDKIMAAYDSLLKSSTAQPRSRAPTPIVPQSVSFNPATYSPSGPLTNTLTQLGNVSKTGGYSDTDIANIRARGVSPIRSVYANAQRNLDRQRALQGGYSPNYTAASTRMARDLSEQIGQANTDVEATIAENVNRNRMSALASLGPLAAEESRMRGNVDISNAEGINRANIMNTEGVNRANETNQNMANTYNQQEMQRYADSINQAMRAIEGKRALYGTNPALINQFAGQVQTGQQLKQSQQQIRQQDPLYRINPIDPWGSSVRLG